MSFNIGDKPRRNLLVSTDQGTMIVNRWDCNHEGVGHSQWLMDHGNVSTVEADTCIRALEGIPQPRIFDIGANIGTFTTWMASAFPGGRIHSFEPQRAVFQMLTGNVAINNLYNVYTYNMGLGAEDTYIEFNEPNYFKYCDFGTFTLNTREFVERTENTVVVEVRTVDSFVATYRIDRVDLMKIDVEGMDLDVLRGAHNTIRKFLPKIFIEHNNNVVSIKDQILEVLDPYGYTCEVIGNNIIAR